MAGQRRSKPKYKRKYAQKYKYKHKYKHNRQTIKVRRKPGWLERDAQNLRPCLPLPAPLSSFFIVCKCCASTVCIKVSGRAIKVREAGRTSG